MHVHKIRCVGYDNRNISWVLRVDDFEHTPFGSIIVPDNFNDIGDDELMSNYFVQDGEIISRTEMPQKIVMISDYGVNCGIATYTKYLCDEIRPLVSELYILAETTSYPVEDDENVIRCWNRSSSDFSDVYNILETIQPDLIIIQHEFGLFPKLDAWNCFLSQLSKWRTVVTMHTVLEHRVSCPTAQLDYRTRFLAEAPCKEIIVHTPMARDTLRDRGYSGRIHYIPHGCFKPDRIERLPATKYGMFSPYSIFQYGFGGTHKGWEFAIETVSKLVKKYPDIIYVGIFNVPLFENDDSYFRKLLSLIRDKKLEKNVAIHRGFQSEEMLRNFIRSCKVALYPYQVPNKNWLSWGASGAIQLPMSLGIPMVLSDYPAFLEFKDRLPIINCPDEAAKEIDRIFSDSDYAAELSENAYAISEERSWDKVASWFLSVSEKEDFDAPI